MGSSALYMVRMDVAHDHEADFNETYDIEHVPALASVPGVRRATRYRHPSPTDPRYLAVYEIESPDVLTSDAWAKAVEQGRWPAQVRPHTSNRRHMLMEKI